MRAVLEGTRIFDARDFLIYGDEVLTYRQHFEKVAALAHWLRSRAFRRAIASRSGCATIQSG
jgi:hypothetical protein